MKIKLLGVVALAACAARADVDLNGSWSFRFEEGKAIEETAGPSFAATDTMSVPGCYDMMPQWFRVAAPDSTAARSRWSVLSRTPGSWWTAWG